MRRLAIATGDPAGIGPEIAVRAAADVAVRTVADVTLVGDGRRLADLAERLGVNPPAGGIVDVGGSGHRPGEVGAESGHAAVAAIRAAVAEVTAGRADALVTGPVSKRALHDAGYAWPGQTEALADICAASDLRVMLVGGGLRVAHVTAHAPLARAIELVTTASVLRTIELSADAARWFELPRPRIAVLGLNPHAGEGGHLGREELDVIIPTLDALRADGMHLLGPLPADTAFVPAQRAHYDAVLAMYHDQALPVLKSEAFDRTVNLTLGLPFIRTSVDHGTALDLAGTGRADPSSLIAAARMAVELAGRSGSPG